MEFFSSLFQFPSSTPPRKSPHECQLLVPCAPDAIHVFVGRDISGHAPSNDVSTTPSHRLQQLMFLRTRILPDLAGGRWMDAPNADWSEDLGCR